VLLTRRWCGQLVVESQRRTTQQQVPERQLSYLQRGEQ